MFLLPSADVTRLLVGHVQPCLPPPMAVVIVPPDVARLTTGHFKVALSVPAGGGEILSPADAGHQHCHYTELKSHIQHMLEYVAILRRFNTPGYDTMSCPRELKPELMIRLIDPKSGEVTDEEVWNDRSFKFLDEDENVKRKPAWNQLLKERMRLRGSRKQTSARAARQLEVLNSQVLKELAESSKKIFKKGRGHDVDDLHPIKQFQGYRMTNFSTGEKYAGTQKDIKEAQLRRSRELGESVSDSETKVVGEGVPDVGKDKLAKMIAAAKKTFGL